MIPIFNNEATPATIDLIISYVLLKLLSSYLKSNANLLSRYKFRIFF